MMYHKWATVGENIYQCPKCGLYRCHALTDFSAPQPGRSAKKIANVEFSDVSGSVVALNPDKQPPCEEGIYV